MDPSRFAVHERRTLVQPSGFIAGQSTQHGHRCSQIDSRDSGGVRHQAENRRVPFDQPGGRPLQVLITGVRL